MITDTNRKATIIAYYFSKLLPKATVIANTTNVNSGVGLDRPVMYKNGVYIKL